MSVYVAEICVQQWSQIKFVCSKIHLKCVAQFEAKEQQQQLRRQPAMEREHFAVLVVFIFIFIYFATHLCQPHGGSVQVWRGAPGVA